MKNCKCCHREFVDEDTFLGRLTGYLTGRFKAEMGMCVNCYRASIRALEELEAEGERKLEQKKKFEKLEAEHKKRSEHKEWLKKMEEKKEREK